MLLKLNLVGQEHAELLSSMQQACYEPQDESHWSTESFRNFLCAESSLAFLAVNDDGPIGFAVLQGTNGEWEIVTLGVLPAYQSHGYAAVMLETVKDLKNEEISTLFLEVRVDNSAAIGLYKKMGFNEIGRRKDYYSLLNGNRVDAVTMKWQKA